MKIKETERLTGIPAANIRYYEKEGLLKPGRNKENNYREYSEEDVLRLQQIKVLRLLGITLDEIKELYMQEETLETVIEHRLLQIEEEETRLKEVRRTCENILQSRMDLESLDQSIQAFQIHPALQDGSGKPGSKYPGWRRNILEGTAAKGACRGYE